LGDGGGFDFSGESDFQQVTGNCEGKSSEKSKARRYDDSGSLDKPSERGRLKRWSSTKAAGPQDYFERSVQIKGRDDDWEKGVARRMGKEKKSRQTKRVKATWGEES